MQKSFRCVLVCGILFIVCGNVYSQERKLRKDAVSDSVKVLKEVAVTAQKSNYIEYHLDKVVVNVSGLIGLTGGNAVDILNSSPGVFVDESGSINLKGRGGVLVYVDDKPTQLSGTDLINYLKSLPTAMIDKIELMSNPSAKYNADGTAIINIRTKKNKIAGFNGSFSVSAGSGRYFRSTNSVLLNYKTNKLNFFLNAGFNASNVYFNSHRQRQYNYPNTLPSYTLRQQVNETNHERSVNYKAGIDYEVNKYTTLGVMYNGYTSPYKEMGKYNNHFYNTAGKPDSFTLSRSRYTQNSMRNALNFNLRHVFAGKEITINADYLEFTNRPRQTLESSFFLPADSLVKQSTFVTRLPFTALIYSARADYSDTLFGKIKAETGIQSIYSERSNSGDYFTTSGNVLLPDALLTSRFRYRERIHSAYINLQGSYKRLSAQAGLRLERTEGNALQYAMQLKPDTAFAVEYTNLFPTVYVMYKADSSGHHIISLSAGKRIERPGYYDLNPSSFYYDRNTSNTGNSLLQPAFTNNLELQYIYKGKFITGINYSKTKGYITRGYKQVGDAFIAIPVNIRRFTNIGLNITWQPDITRWWNLNLYQEFTANGFNGSIDGNEYKAAIQKRVTYNVRAYNRFKFNKGWVADLTAIYRTKVFLWQASLRPIWQMHAGVLKKLNEKATVTFAVKDIFHSWKLTRDIVIPYGQVYYHLEFDTQRINFTFSYRFGKLTGNKERRTGIDAEAGRVN
jgi:iron complex outermembrane recepter protein